MSGITLAELLYPDCNSAALEEFEEPGPDRFVLVEFIDGAFASESEVFVGIALEGEIRMVFRHVGIVTESIDGESASKIEFDGVVFRHVGIVAALRKLVQDFPDSQEGVAAAIKLLNLLVRDGILG